MIIYIIKTIFAIYCFAFLTITTFRLDFKEIEKKGKYYILLSFIICILCYAIIISENLGYIFNFYKLYDIL